jgi:SH3-like domain-containing protein
VPPIPTAVPQEPLPAKVNVASLNLRSGPGTLFDVQGTYALDTQVTALGRAPNGDWIEIEDAAGKKGWVYAEMLTLEGELATLPVLETPESLVIFGKVIDSSGQPINGVQVQVTAQLFQIAVQFVTHSGADGIFYAYFPPRTVGVWLVQIIGTECDSRIVDGNCNVVEYILYNDSAYVQLPATAPLVFVYEKASNTIPGTVQDASGKVVSSMRVFATRSDGASASAISSATGSFTLPASPGVWKVYAVQFNPTLEGEAVYVTVPESSQPDPITVLSPQQAGPTATPQ